MPEHKDSDTSKARAGVVATIMMVGVSIGLGTGIAIKNMLLGGAIGMGFSTVVALLVNYIWTKKRG